MRLLCQMKEAIAAGKLTEPCTSHQVAQGLCCPDWSLERVQQFLARHCSGNLATFSLLLRESWSGAVPSAAMDRSRSRV